ncbi:hypothetical protein M8C17_03105 [Micromonospora sp. RHAY321]|uniref:hypothetical protein n=1 Tax=Micromonospora sp. RHAY321 TaxID=2944807 RepID=UPI00207C81FA|nr:hypothetical protein [Micromonospora sp. RHAY321]MCO1594141.1 hypothetical protein [Micromonospora sp. RHAY321]
MMTSDDRRPPKKQQVIPASGRLAWWATDESTCTPDTAGVNKDLPKVTLELWQADALVLFDWLQEVDLNAVPISHPAQKQALMDLLTRLEETAAADATHEEIAAAKAEVSQDMGW